jgi:hypothetical protein
VDIYFVEQLDMHVHTLIVEFGKETNRVYRVSFVHGIVNFGKTNNDIL